MLPLSYPVRQWYITIWNSRSQNTRGGSKNLTRKSFHVGILQICTPSGILTLIDSTGVDMTGKECVIIGRSNIVGKPMALLALHRNATVTICHSRTQNLPEVTRRADILISAVGKAGFVTGEMVKPGAVVVDVGMNRNAAGKLCGDVDFESVSPVAGWLTPVPGGVGPMTITMLLRSTVLAAEKHHKKP